MGAILWRVILAVICVVLIYALIPPVCRIIGFDPSGDVLLVLKICIGGLAVLYIIRGPNPPWLSA
jgi:hypothetical protein